MKNVSFKLIIGLLLLLISSPPAFGGLVRDRLENTRTQERVKKTSRLDTRHGGPQAAFLKPDITVLLKSVPEAPEVARIKELIIAQTEAINDVRYIGSNVFQVVLQRPLSWKQRDAFRDALKASGMVASVEFIDYSKQ